MQFNSHMNIEVKGTIEFGYAEIRAMHELAMYGDEAFMRLVESGLSPTLAKRHGAALCGILAAFRHKAPAILKAAEASVKSFNESLPAGSASISGP